MWLIDQVSLNVGGRRAGFDKQSEAPRRRAAARAQSGETSDLVARPLGQYQRRHSRVNLLPSSFVLNTHRTAKVWLHSPASQREDRATADRGSLLAAWRPPKAGEAQEFLLNRWADRGTAWCLLRTGGEIGRCARCALRAAREAPRATAAAAAVAAAARISRTRHCSLRRKAPGATAATPPKNNHANTGRPQRGGCARSSTACWMC